MLFAFALIPLVGAVGAAVDYSQAARSRTHMLEASNVSALAAARVAQNYMNQNGFASSAWPQAQVVAQSEMSQIFAANEAADTNAHNVAPVLTMTLNADGSVSATVVATATSNTMFMRLLGVPTVPLRTLATAKGGGFTYYQIVFVADVSNSMGIGGTSADITSLLNDKLIACAFACHDPNQYRPDTTSYYCRQNSTDANCHTSGATYCPSLSYWQGVDTTTSSRGVTTVNTTKANSDYKTNCTQSYGTTPFADKRALAKQFGYKLKIDYVTSAISSFVTQLTPYMTAASTKNLFAVSMWTFGTTIKQVQAPTNDATTLATTSSAIDLEGAVPSTQNYGYTYTTQALQQAMAGTPNQGDGTSATSRKTYFILLSDGAEDVPGSSNWGRIVDVNYLATCTAMKQPVIATNPNSNPIVFSIEAAYPPISPDTDGQYTALILNKGLNTTIPTTMKACASSSDDYFLASDGPGIQAAVSQVFSNIIGGNLHLTQ